MAAKWLLQAAWKRESEIDSKRLSKKKNAEAERSSRYEQWRHTPEALKHAQGSFQYFLLSLAARYCRKHAHATRSFTRLSLRCPACWRLACPLPRPAPRLAALAIQPVYSYSFPQPVVASTRRRTPSTSLLRRTRSAKEPAAGPRNPGAVSRPVSTPRQYTGGPAGLRHAKWMRARKAERTGRLAASAPYRTDCN